MKSVANRRTKSQKPATKAPAPPAAEAPKPVTVNPLEPGLEAIYEDGRIRSDLPLMQLVRLMYDTYQGTGLNDPTAAFLGHVLLCNADDIDMVRNLDETIDHSDLVARVHARVEQRAHIAVEIARRAENGGAS